MDQSSGREIAGCFHMTLDSPRISMVRRPTSVLDACRSLQTKLFWVPVSLIAAACLVRLFMHSEQVPSFEIRLGSSFEESLPNMKLAEYDLEAMVEAIRKGRLRSQDLVKVG
jgi:hypothetical protein